MSRGEDIYRPLLFSIAYGMTGSVGDAEDIVQDAFVGLTRARQAGTVIADQKAYLKTAVTRLGIVKVEQLTGNRRYAYLGCAIVAAALPGVDPISMLLETAPLIVLYELSIGLAKAFGTPAERLEGQPQGS